MVTTALVTLISLEEPGALYDAAKVLDLQDVPIMATCDPDAMVWQEQALKTEAVCPNLTPVPTRTGHQYRTTWVKGVPISHKGEVQVHVWHSLGVEGRLAAYQLVGPEWQLIFINVHVPFCLWGRHRDIPRTFHGGLPTGCHEGADCHHRRLQCSSVSA